MSRITDSTIWKYTLKAIHILQESLQSIWKYTLEAVHILQKSLQWMNKNRKQTILIILLDILFVFLYGVVTAPYFAKNIEYVVEIGSAISRHAVLYPTSTTGFFGILHETGSMPAVSSFLLLNGLLILSVYILYCAFGGSAWWLARKSVGEQQSYPEYIKQFAKVNIVWGLLIVVGHIISYSQQLVTTMKTGAIAPTAWFVILYFFLIGYFSSISYTRLNQHPWTAITSSFRIGIVKIKQLAIPCIGLLILLLGIDLVLLGAKKISLILMIILGFVLVFPFLTFARSSFSHIMQAIEKEPKKHENRGMESNIYK